MHKRKVAVVVPTLIALIQVAQLSADDLPYSSVEIDLRFHSNLIDRGEDLYADHARQKGMSYGSTTGAWNFAPTATFHTPISGLTFEIEGRLALEGRNHVDSDHRLQYAPSGADILTSGNQPVISIRDGLKPERFESVMERQKAAWDAVAKGEASVHEFYTAISLGNEEHEFGEGYGVPGFHRETNGLKMQDRLYMTIDWNKDFRFGNYGFGITTESFVNSSNKSPHHTEMYFNYSPWFFPDFTFEVTTHIEHPEHYYAFIWSPSYELNENIAVNLDLTAGYSVMNRLQGWRDYTGRLGLEWSGFGVGLNMSRRPNLSFFDEDENVSRHWPVGLNGDSHQYDGLVVDPAQNSSLYHALINTAINSEIASHGFNYAWTPRQKLPRDLYWVDIGYMMKF